MTSQAMRANMDMHVIMHMNVNMNMNTGRPPQGKRREGQNRPGDVVNGMVGSVTPAGSIATKILDVTEIV